MTQRESDDQYPPEEADRRRDDALRRALNMPAAPHEAMKVGKPRQSTNLKRPKNRAKAKQSPI
jgi:hypothetical protein